MSGRASRGGWERGGNPTRESLQSGPNQRLAVTAGSDPALRRGAGGAQGPGTAVLPPGRSRCPAVPEPPAVPIHRGGAPCSAPALSPEGREGTAAMGRAPGRRCGPWGGGNSGAVDGTERVGRPTRVGGRGPGGAGGQSGYCGT